MCHKMTIINNIFVIVFVLFLIVCEFEKYRYGSNFLIYLFLVFKKVKFCSLPCLIIFWVWQKSSKKLKKSKSRLSGHSSLRG